MPEESSSAIPDVPNLSDGTVVVGHHQPPDLRLDHRRRPVTGSALDSLIERRVADLEDPDRRREREAEDREMSVPELRPASRTSSPPLRSP